MWGMILRVGVLAVASAGIGFAVGVSLPQIREKLKEQEDREKKELEAERQREREQDRDELEQVRQMSPEAQVRYFERRREREEKRSTEERALRREKAARASLGGLLILVGTRFRAAAFLILLGREIAGSIVSVTAWVAGILKGEPGAAPLRSAA